MERRNRREGFTLIELSIVLVIIGLIVGGVLVSRDLIRAAEVRATISQIQNYQTAANTFLEKYGYLPGDIKDPEATKFGFAARGTLEGQGNGNGLIMGSYGGVSSGISEAAGEVLMFWADLSKVNLIDGSFTKSMANGVMLPYPRDATNSQGFMPLAKLGRGNYLYVYSGGYNSGSWVTTNINYFGLSAVTSVTGAGTLTSSPALTVAQAYAIDKKMDDGLAQTGNATAQYVNFGLGYNSPVWAAGGGAQGMNDGGYPPLPTTFTTGGSSTTCYDNGGVNGAAQQYSMKQNGGAGVNCALSFQFQ